MTFLPFLLDCKVPWVYKTVAYKKSIFFGADVWKCRLYYLCVCGRAKLAKSLPAVEDRDQQKLNSRLSAGYNNINNNNNSLRAYRISKYAAVCTFCYSAWRHYFDGRYNAILMLWFPENIWNNICVQIWFTNLSFSMNWPDRALCNEHLIHADWTYTHPLDIKAVDTKIMHSKQASFIITARQNVQINILPDRATLMVTLKKVMPSCRALLNAFLNAAVGQTMWLIYCSLPS